MPNERSQAFNDGYLDGRMNYNKECPYDDIPNIKEYSKGLKTKRMIVNP